jgi:hypothetical protein
LGQLIDQLDATNPQTYQLPAEIKNSAGLKDRMDASSSDDMDRRDLDGEERPRKRVSKYKVVKALTLLHLQVVIMM